MGAAPRNDKVCGYMEGEMLRRLFMDKGSKQMGAAPRNDKVCGYMEGEIASSLV